MESEAQEYIEKLCYDEYGLDEDSGVPNQGLWVQELYFQDS